MAGNICLPINEEVKAVLRDQTDPVIDFLFTQSLDATQPLASDVVISSRTMIMSTGLSQVSVGNIIELTQSGRIYQGAVLSIGASTTIPNSIVLDTPFDFGYLSSWAVLDITNSDLSVDGSSVPVTFTLKPPSPVNWDITRVIIHIADGTVMDTGTFGGLTALLNGVVFRVDSLNEIRNIFNAKTNGDLKLRMFDSDFSTKAPAGTFGFTVRRTFAGQSKNGVSIHLHSNDSDQLEIIVQDDLTGLLSMDVIGQGHISST